MAAIRGVCAGAALALAVVVLSFVAVADGAPTEVYVSPFGSNSNSGASPEEPLLTIAKALSLVQASGTIYLDSGIYSGNQNYGIQFPIGAKVSNYNGTTPTITCGNIAESSGAILNAASKQFGTGSILFQGVQFLSCTYGISVVSGGMSSSYSLNLPGSQFSNIAKYFFIYKSGYTGITFTITLSGQNAGKPSNPAVQFFSSTPGTVLVYVSIANSTFNSFTNLFSGTQSLTVSGSTFTNCGTAITSSSSLSVSGSVFTNNARAISFRGTLSEALSVSDCIFSNNGPDEAILVNGLTAGNTHIKIVNSAFTFNSRSASNSSGTGSQGGVVSLLNCAGGSYVAISQSCFQSNSGLNGGAALFYNSIVNLASTRFTGNAASIIGGGFAVSNGSVVEGSGNTIQNNTAKGLPNGYACTGSTVQLSNSVVSGGVIGDCSSSSSSSSSSVEPASSPRQVASCSTPQFQRRIVEAQSAAPRERLAMLQSLVHMLKN